MKVAIIVVLYDKKIEKSSTIRTLIEGGIRNAHLVIHNNGPFPVSIPDVLVDELFKMDVSVSLVNCIENKPLANLYNDFIDEYYSFDKFIILDDDSNLTRSYIESIYFDDYDLEVPKIVSIADKKTYYPMYKDKVIESDVYLDASIVSSIGSGLILTRSFIEKFYTRNMNVFDENYAFYGVDISLFRRMRRLIASGDSFTVKSSSTILHSLSRTEGSESVFRQKERLIDYAIGVRRYPSIWGYSSFVKKGVRQLSTFKIKEFFSMCGYFISGVHPRSRKWNQSKKSNERK